MNKTEFSNDDYKIKQVLLVRGYHACVSRYGFAKAGDLKFRFACVLKEVRDAKYPRDLIYDLIQGVEACLCCDDIVLKEEWWEWPKIFNNPDSAIKKLCNTILRQFTGLSGLKKRVYETPYSSILEYKKFQLKTNSYNPLDDNYGSFSVIFNRNKKPIAFWEEEIWWDYEDMQPYTDSLTLAVYTANDISVELTGVFRDTCTKYGIRDISFIEGAIDPLS